MMFYCCFTGSESKVLADKEEGVKLPWTLDSGIYLVFVIFVFVYLFVNNCAKLKPAGQVMMMLVANLLRQKCICICSISMFVFISYFMCIYAYICLYLYSYLYLYLYFLHLLGVVQNRNLRGAVDGDSGARSFEAKMSTNLSLSHIQSICLSRSRHICQLLCGM